MAGTPADTVIYAIGDIHGRLDLLSELHERILADADGRHAAHRLLIYLGDYVSRGPESCAVVERVRSWKPGGFRCVTLRGNHEELLLRYLDGDLSAGRHWFDFGGLETLAAYGVRNHGGYNDTDLEDLRCRFGEALPEAHRDFFRRLQVSHRVGRYFFVHGGIRPGIALEDQRAQDCIWIRGEFLSSEAEHGAIVVHGHSISEAPELRNNRIGIDTGAYRSGVLTCLVLDGVRQDFLQTGAGAAGHGTVE